MVRYYSKIPPGVPAVVDQIRSWKLSVHRRPDSWTKLPHQQVPSSSSETSYNPKPQRIQPGI